MKHSGMLSLHACTHTFLRSPRSGRHREPFLASLSLYIRRPGIRIILIYAGRALAAAARVSVRRKLCAAASAMLTGKLRLIRVNEQADRPGISWRTLPGQFLYARRSAGSFSSAHRELIYVQLSVRLRVSFRNGVLNYYSGQKRAGD